MSRIVVDLSQAELRVRMVERFDLSASIADELYIGTRRLLNADEVACSHDDILRATEAYFLLSEAYKIERLGHAPQDAKHTKNPKKAALTAITTFHFRPFRLVDENRQPLNSVSRIANLQFALDFAATILKDDFAYLTRDMQFCLFRFLRSVNLSSLAESTADQMRGEFKTRYVIDIEPDLPIVEMLVLFFELHGSGDDAEDDD